MNAPIQARSIGGGVGVGRGLPPPPLFHAAKIFLKELDPQTMKIGLVSNIENCTIIYSLEYVLPGNVFFFLSLIVFLYNVVKYGVINCQVGLFAWKWSRCTVLCTCICIIQQMIEKYVCREIKINKCVNNFVYCNMLR